MIGWDPAGPVGGAATLAGEASVVLPLAVAFALFCHRFLDPLSALAANAVATAALLGAAEPLLSLLDSRQATPDLLASLGVHLRSPPFGHVTVTARAPLSKRYPSASVAPRGQSCRPGHGVRALVRTRDVNPTPISRANTRTGSRASMPAPGSPRAKSTSSTSTTPRLARCGGAQAPHRVAPSRTDGSARSRRSGRLCRSSGRATLLSWIRLSTGSGRPRRRDRAAPGSRERCVEPLALIDSSIGHSESRSPVSVSNTWTWCGSVVTWIVSPLATESRWETRTMMLFGVPSTPLVP